MVKKFRIISNLNGVFSDLSVIRTMNNLACKWLFNFVCRIDRSIIMIASNYELKVVPLKRYAAD